MNTILEEAVALAVPFLDAEAANKQIIALLRQVGKLEIEAAALAEGLKLAQGQVSSLRERNAALEVAIEAISAVCYWRAMGYCWLECPGRAFCDVAGLIGFAKPDMRGT